MNIGQFIYNLVSGTAAHLLSMIAGVILALLIFGKADEGLIFLLIGVVLPFFAAGAFIAYRKIPSPIVIAACSAILALLAPPIIVAAYQDWRWSAIGSSYFFTVLAIPCSVFGCLSVQSKRASKILK